MKLVKGDRVVQVNVDYGTSKVGWTGTVVRSSTSYGGVLSVKVLFDNHHRPMVVKLEDLKRQVLNSPDMTRLR